MWAEQRHSQFTWSIIKWLFLFIWKKAVFKLHKIHSQQNNLHFKQNTVVQVKFVKCALVSPCFIPNFPCFSPMFLLQININIKYNLFKHNTINSNSHFYLSSSVTWVRCVSLFHFLLSVLQSWTAATGYQINANMQHTDCDDHHHMISIMMMMMMMIPRQNVFPFITNENI